MRHIVPKQSNQSPTVMRMSQKDKDDMEKTLRAEKEMQSIIT